MWGILIAVLFLGSGAAYYLKTQNDAKVAAKGSLVSVSTMVVGLGDLHATVRVNGTVNAQNFAALMAPRILGSRSGLNRGGDSGSMNSGGGGGGGGGPMGDFSLVLMKLAKPGVHVKSGDMVAEFDPQNQLQRLDDYKDPPIQQENMRQEDVGQPGCGQGSPQPDPCVRPRQPGKRLFSICRPPTYAAPSMPRNSSSRWRKTTPPTSNCCSEADLVDESQLAQIRVSELNRDQSKIEVHAPTAT